MKNTITYERLMEALYKELMDEEIARNAIETEEMQNKLCDYEKKYLSPYFKLSYDLYCKEWNDVSDIAYSYCRGGFYAGFKAAVALFETKQSCDLG